MNESAEGPHSSGDKQSVYRILDANGNRAGEALRVVEEHCRFVVADATLSQQLKQLRHELDAVLQSFSLTDRLAARDTEHDVGTAIETAEEMHRRDRDHVVAANLKRLQQSLRSLEEYAKIISASAARTFQDLRYRCYTLEKEIVLVNAADQRRRRIAAARFYVLMDGRLDEAECCRSAAAVLNAGAEIIQLRDKTLCDRDLLARARALRLVVQPPALLIVNDRPDIAVLSQADGVHVGQDELSLPDARQIVGHDLLIGVSTHDLAQARRAVEQGADYLGLGPTFSSTTKTFARFAGLEFLTQVAEQIDHPAFAIGGITLHNVSSVFATGIQRIAVSGALWNTSDPAAAMRAFRDLAAAPD